MYFIHYSYNKNIGYVWRGFKTNPRPKNSPPSRFEIPGSATELYTKETTHPLQTRTASNTSLETSDFWFKGEEVTNHFDLSFLLISFSGWTFLTTVWVYKNIV